MFTKMLVPLDGSEVSEGILPWVTQVATSLDIPAVLISIMDPNSPLFQEQVAPPSLSLHMGRLPLLTLAADRRDNIGVSREESRYDLPDSGGNPKKKDIEEMAELEKWLRGRASMLECQGVNILEEKIVTAHDRPSQVILQAAAEHGCDFVAMATHDRNLLERTFQGSVTNEVVRSAGFPVLAITPEKQSGSSDQPVTTSRLLVLLDGSDFAESVIPYVKELGLRLSLEVVLIRWLTGSQVHPASSGAGSVPADANKLREEAEQEVADEATLVRQYLQTTAADLAEAGLKVRWEIPEVALDSAGSHLSRECANSVIMLASHGRSGLSRWLLQGSVAEDLLRDSGCPVLVIPSALADQEEADDSRG
jgi:nucleotide-binding universal stress UspA family protein